MTDAIDIHKLQELHSKTTWGVWKVYGINGKYIGAFHPVTGSLRQNICEASDHNMNFIVEVRNQLPTILSTLIKQDSCIKELGKKLEETREAMYKAQEETRFLAKCCSQIDEALAKEYGREHENTPDVWLDHAKLYAGRVNVR